MARRLWCQPRWARAMGLAMRSLVRWGPLSSRPAYLDGHCHRPYTCTLHSNYANGKWRPAGSNRARSILRMIDAVGLCAVGRCAPKPRIIDRCARVVGHFLVYEREVAQGTRQRRVRSFAWNGREVEQDKQGTNCGGSLWRCATAHGFAHQTQR